MRKAPPLGSAADRGASSSGTLTRSFALPLSQRARRPSEPAVAGLPEIRSVLVAQTIRDLGRGERGIREELDRELAAMGIAELTIRRAGFPEPADQRALRDREPPRDLLEWSSALSPGSHELLHERRRVPPALQALGHGLEAQDRDPVQGGIGERGRLIQPRLRDHERAHLGAEAHRPGKVTSIKVCMGGAGRDLHLRSLELAAEDRLEERLEAQEERLDLGHALLLEEIDPLVELDAHLPPDAPQIEAEARVADVPVANEKLEGIAERRRAHCAEAQRAVGSGPEAGADGEGPPRRSDGVHVPALTELLTEGDLLAERGGVRGIHAGAFQDRFAERPRRSELLEHELEVRRRHRQVVGGAPQTPCQRTTFIGAGYAPIPPSVTGSPFVGAADPSRPARSEEHTSELQSLRHLVC